MGTKLLLPFLFEIIVASTFAMEIPKLDPCRHYKIAVSGGVSFQFTIHKVSPTPPKDFATHLEPLIAGKKIVSFGEEHNLNKDKTYGEINKYKDLIFSLYGTMKLFRFKNLSELVEDMRRREPNSKELKDLKALLEYCAEEGNEKDFSKVTSSRIFASHVIPTLKKEGFTDVVIEGFNEDRPSENYELSKDRTGYLLIMLTAMTHDLKIHGAYSGGLDFGFGVAESFRHKVDSITAKDPKARVATYNGGAHNLTVPMTGNAPFIGRPMSELSFVPHFSDKYGDKFKSIDLVTKSPTATDQVRTPYDVLRQTGDADSVNVVDYAAGQTAFVFPQSRLP